MANTCHITPGYKNLYYKHFFMIEQTETVERTCCVVPNVILPYNKHVFYSEFQFRSERVTVQVELLATGCTCV
jgi:hypothetical protein